MENETQPLYEPWTEFDLVDLKKYFKEFERKLKIMIRQGKVTREKQFVGF